MYIYHIWQVNHGLLKFQIFWEGHKDLTHLPLFIWHYLAASNFKRKINQIFIAFSEYLKFNVWRLSIGKYKIWIFREGQKICKNLPLKIWRYSVSSNYKWKIFSNFVAFSEYPNFTAGLFWPFNWRWDRRIFFQAIVNFRVKVHQILRHFFFSLTLFQS